MVRDWVGAAAPSNVNLARRFLRATTGMVLWADRVLGRADVRVVLEPRNIDYWVMVVNAEQKPAWRETIRGSLRTVGRAVNPDWPPPSPTIGRRAVAAPYTPVEETGLVRAARLVGRVNRPARLWVVGGSLGAGLMGPELFAAGTGDLVEVVDGRLAIQVRGRKPRLVPIRRTYTDLVWEAIGDTCVGRFVKTKNIRAVHAVVESLILGRGKGFSLRRGRSTWLVAHIADGTPLQVVKRIAGSLSGTTLDELLYYTVDTSMTTPPRWRDCGHDLRGTPPSAGRPRPRTAV